MINAPEKTPRRPKKPPGKLLIWGLSCTAFSYGMINGGDIDLILDEQSKNYRPFGEIAMSMGMLTHEQVDGLHQVQQMRATVEVAEALALSGVCPTDQIMTQLGRFFSRQEVSPVTAQG